MITKSLLMSIATLIVAINCMAQVGSKPETVKDIDGNIYHTITIGTQTWMAENLKTTHYNDGTAIPNVTDGTIWKTLSTGAFCSYDNSVTNDTKYGKLYNWYSFNTGKLAPIGWHIATDAEWITLNDFVKIHLGTSGTVAKALASTSDWISSSNAGAIGNDLTKNNGTGFSALPGGVRLADGSFDNIDYKCFWWSSMSSAEYRGLDRTTSYLTMGNYKGGGIMYVRCVKD